MILPITKFAELYFTLKDLEKVPFENYANSFRVYRNLEILKPFGERYMKEMQEEAQKISESLEEGQEEILLTQTNSIVFQKWMDSGESEDLPLKTLDLGKEKLPLSPVQLGILLPILENIDDL